MPSFRSAVLCLAAVAQIATAWPTKNKHASIVTREEDIEDEYDYVIVGGGTSGLTVGDRLTENGKYSVLVIEEGLFHSETGMNPSRMYSITSEPSPELGDRKFSVGIGNAVGGSSIVNGQVFLRGTRDEYNAWAALGEEGSSWNWDGLLPYFRKGITLVPPEEEQAKEFNITYDMQYWGTDSNIYATFGRATLSPVIKVLYNAMSKIPGVDIPIDHGAGQTGLYWYTLSQEPDTYVRSYSRTGHWNRIHRDNYQMIVGAKVDQIIFDDDMTATGVVFHSKNGTDAADKKVYAKREVILAAGAIHTPQILMLSGVGSAEHLEEAGIEVKVDLPGVGSNFQDHSYIPNIGYRWGKKPEGDESPGPGGFSGPSGGPPNLATMIGLPVITPDHFEELADEYENQDPTEHLPAHYTKEQIRGYKEQQKVYAELMRSKNVVFLELMMFGPGGSVQNLHCMSRGDVRLNTKDPKAEVIVDYRAGSNHIDLKVMVEIIKFMRRYMTTGELEQYEAEEVTPGSEVQTDEGILEWARQQIIPSVFHPIGTTAKMPREWGGVVNEDLLVYGTKNLRIIDSGMMPTIVGATTSMTVYAVAEKAADIIKEQTYDAEDWEAEKAGAKKGGKEKEDKKKEDKKKGDKKKEDKKKGDKKKGDKKKDDEKKEPEDKGDKDKEEDECTEIGD